MTPHTHHDVEKVGGCLACTPAFLTMKEECAKLARSIRVVRAGPVTEVYETVRHAMPTTRGQKGARPPTRKACSSLRAQRMVRWLSAGNGEPGTAYFFTATFSDDVKDYDDALSRWKKFRRLLRNTFEDVRYIAVPEIQPRSGRWHFHAVFCNLPTEEQFLDAYGWERSKKGKTYPGYKKFFQTMWSNANGHAGDDYEFDIIDIQVARSIGGVCGYLVKYLCKDVGGVVPAGRRNYFAGGKDLVRPLELNGREFIPETTPAFAVMSRDRFGNKTAFSRYVELPPEAQAYLAGANA